MFDLAQLFSSSTAMAQDPNTGAPGGLAGGLMNYLPFILIFGVFYFLVIRPQQKKLQDQEKMIKALQRGDRVITSGGIHGKITKLDGDTQLTLEIANGVEIKIERGHVQGLEPAPGTVIEGEKK